MRQQVQTYLGVLLLLGLTISLANARKRNLKALCSGEKVSLRTIDHIRYLADELESPEGNECDEEVKTAIRELDKMTDERPEGVCTMAKAEAITRFVESHLKSSAGEEAKSKLPEPLVKFAIAYGMEVSRVCSHKMVSDFAGRARMKFRILHSVWEPFRKPLFRQIGDKSLIAKLLNPIMKTGELVLPADFMQALPGINKQVDLLVPKNSDWLRMKLLCEHVFQPLYEPVLLPLAHLNRAGFNNREWYWQKRFHRNGHYWSHVVFMCETFKLIGADPKQGPEVSPEEEAKIRSELEAALKSVSNNYAEKKQADQQVVGQDEEQVRVGFASAYDREVEEKKWQEEEDGKPESQTGNTIYGRFDFSKRSLVKNFDANTDHVELLRERIRNRSFQIVRELFKRKGFGELIKKAVSSINAKKESDDQLEKAKRELVSLMEAPGGTSLAYKVFVGLPKLIRETIGLFLLILIADPALIGVSTLGQEKDADYFEFVSFFSSNRMHLR